MRIAKQSFIVLLLLLFCISCATFESSTYKTLYVGGTAYDVAMKTVSRLQAQGLITDTQRADINKLANIYYVSYHASVDAFEVYHQAKTAEAKDALVIALTSASLNWSKMAEYVNRIVPKAMTPVLEEVQ